MADGDAEVPEVSPNNEESEKKVVAEDTEEKKEELDGHEITAAASMQSLLDQVVDRPTNADDEEAKLLEAVSEYAVKEVNIEEPGEDGEQEDGQQDVDHKDDQAYSSVQVVVSGFDLAMDDDEEIVEEEIEESEPSLPTPLDRFPYYERYLDAMKEYGVIKRVNNFYHKKMAEYFKKRKMEHVMRESEHPEEVYMKYAKKLDNFYDLISRDKEQRGAINREMSNMKAVRDERCSNAFEDFKGMMLREKEIGSGLIYTKTGKEIPDKALDKMINIQRDKAAELQELRLTHIKIRNAVTDKHAAIRAMDRIGDNYTLMEFEQLKMENQGHADKIEERDEELSQLRKKCNGAMQCLAHVREKCSAVEIKTKIYKSNFDDKENDRIKAREMVNVFKLQRDNYRNETQRMKEESGLLTKDKLLNDMERSMEEIKSLEELLANESKRFEKLKRMNEQVKKSYERETKKVKCMIAFAAVRKESAKKRGMKKKNRNLSVDQRLSKVMSKQFFIKIDDF
ncbi:PREDICTED: coiled-coil domain-containing protein 96-like [Nicrophorus vespilloides]|uniref:Coiled-coil domain-containing protein 96-like n=1 Tax=Nicrophorus vespilloides TaxID=110193 RepID=A0ABM1MJ19_NICVS|nr:PREDICTED: coiled-coil domain-containing protein 96-like [Nicrophorus vespilloides]